MRSQVATSAPACWSVRMLLWVEHRREAVGGGRPQGGPVLKLENLGREGSESREVAVVAAQETAVKLGARRVKLVEVNLLADTFGELGHRLLIRKSSHHGVVLVGVIEDVVELVEEGQH